MRFIFILWLIVTTLTGQAAGRENSPEISPAKGENPIRDYLIELDEVGQTLSGWEGDQEELSSWFFSAYAMLILSNNGDNDMRPFSNLESLVPPFWEDLKYMTPRYLVELAGGVLSYGGLMSLTADRSLPEKRTEEQFILVVSGYGYLRMLCGTVGDSQFQEIISLTMSATRSPELIASELLSAISKISGESLSEQFEIALTSGTWMDVGIDKIRKQGDSTDVIIKHFSTWSFPVEVLAVEQNGDSSYYTYDLNQTKPLRVRGRSFKRIILDPHHKLAEYYRFNNKWPKIKNNIYIQPFAALPDWESYRIVLSPRFWSDWDGEKRYALKLSSGFGVDLWPAYPSDYRHRISTEISVHTPIDRRSHWGGRVNYSHPIMLHKRLFAIGQAHSYDDWSGVSIGLTKYIGQQRFLIEGPKLRYQRLGLSVEEDRYGDPLIWQGAQDIQLLRASYTGLSLTRYGDRLYVNLISAFGKGPENTFSIFKSQVDLSGVFWKWLVGGLHFVSGSQSSSTPGPYQFTHDYAWQDNLAALPNFRGQARSTQRPHNYLGGSLSGGYWVSWYQAKLFASGMLYDNDDLKLTQVKPQYAAGFGFEHKSLFTVGLYFPVWQSHPLAGEEHWAWRYQWRFTWNL